MRLSAQAANLVCIALCWSASLSAERLTVERIFSAPDLTGPRLRSPQVSPEGRYVTFLQGKPSNADQLDLWGLDIRSGETRLLVDSTAFIAGPETLSTEEEARRERQRIASLRGIVDYEFSRDGRKLLVPIAGDLYLYDLIARNTDPVRRLTRSAAYETEAHLSPSARFVSFVRDRNVWLIDLRTGTERQLTTANSELISNGTAEFIAQEEMGRSRGYWWSPNDNYIAYTRVDESPVAEIDRFQIDGDGVRVVKQRYPAAGAANAAVELHVVRLSDNQHRKIVASGDAYLARVDWFPDSQHLAVQRQARNQKTLDLLKVNATTGETTTLLSETSNTWINLHDDLTFLARGKQFIWASSRTGYKHLYLYDFDGKLVRPLTAGNWMVVGDNEDKGMVGVDEQRGFVYYMSNAHSPLERHLYRTRLDGRDPKLQRISLEAGWHSAVLLPDRNGYLDTWSSSQQPPNVSLRTLNGKVQRSIVRNSLDASHPYAPYLVEHSPDESGSLRASDGQTLHYRLTKPKQMQPGQRYPVVVDVYGGPGIQYLQDAFMGGSRAAQGLFRQVLAQNGFIVFSLDNRGSGMRGVQFEAPIHKQLGDVEIEDQLLGVEYLKSLPFVDAKRIGIMGWSYGGYMTLLALAKSNAFKVGMAGAPVTDWSLYDTHYTERFLGMPQANAAGYRASNVLPYIADIKGKLLLVHGMADDNVLFTHSTQLMQQLQQHSIRFDLMTYPGGKHGLPRDSAMGRHHYLNVLEFFRERL